MFTNLFLKGTSSLEIMSQHFQIISFRHCSKSFYHQFNPLFCILGFLPVLSAISWPTELERNARLASASCLTNWSWMCQTFGLYPDNKFQVRLKDSSILFVSIPSSRTVLIQFSLQSFSSADFHVGDLAVYPRPGFQSISLFLRWHHIFCLNSANYKLFDYQVHWRHMRNVDYQLWLVCLVWFSLPELRTSCRHQCQKQTEWFTLQKKIVKFLQ